ncbi:MAG TPA: hypothetical protein VFZ61_27520 [Polyangiales bacterium]
MRITSSGLLRTASVVTALFALGHSSGYPWTPGATAAAQAVARDMQRVTFEAEGALCSYWNFYLGFGLIVSCGLASVALMLWWLAPLARKLPRDAAPFIGIALAFMTANSWLSFRYFFLIPGLFSVVACALLISALLVARSEWRAASGQA